MVVPPHMTDEEHAITFAVGDCIFAWATVELQIASILKYCLATESLPGSAVWDVLQSFRGKVAILRAALLPKFSQPPVNDELRVLLKRVEALYTKRSAVAHSTLIHEDGKRFVIEPYLTLSGVGNHITLEELGQYRSDFVELAQALAWLSSERLTSRAPYQGVLLIPPKPRPDLFQRLLDEEAQSRLILEQQQLDRDLVKRLRKAGKWPPPEA